MNKIWKSSTKWRRLPKRVSPLLNVVQALASVAAVVLFLLLFQYRQSTAATQLREVRYTAYIDEKSHPLASLARELDPADFLHNNPGKLAVPHHIYENSNVKLELPRPGRAYALSGAVGFKKFAADGMVPTADPVVMPSEIKLFREMPETQCIMYDRSGKELARWKKSSDAGLQTMLFRIEGKGIYQRQFVVSSSGDRAVDQQILRKAIELQLSDGLYSVTHPAGSVKGK